MQEQHVARVELFVSNNQIIKKSFKWQNVMMHRLAALLYAAENKQADGDTIRQSHELIKQNTNLFSVFRGNSAISIATMLSLTKEQETKLADTLLIYDLMKKNKFRTSDYLVIAAYQIAAHAKPDQFEHRVERTKTFYDHMKAQHRFLTGQDDYIFAAMLALSDLDVESGVTRMEHLYTELKPEFSPGNSVQALTQVLVLGDDNPDAGARVLALNEAFRRRDIRMDKMYTLPSLGILSLLPADRDTLVAQVEETFELLRTQKGFGAWSINKQELLLLSSSLVAVQYVEDLRNGVLTTAISTSITNIIIAQQAAMAAAATSAAVVASSSSS
ncbi:hypothetical protein B2I21_29875 [Chryseobacterium mucoviscidosis]|uniref:DUF4003 family protein n=1 Tax=unclassified Paenibacillus TaxID=185978 RepID=UPI0009A2E4A6|nr:DUF4003 family protein [Paenibacillus sp. 11B]MDN8591757.1 DUF4003 family protein [Paenibacillus sp. 11B]OPG94741.1 hypothetical protein B2I21_29875 [Chryseobacterium mucoviscidosis]